MEAHEGLAEVLVAENCGSGLGFLERLTRIGHPVQPQRTELCMWIETIKDVSFRSTLPAQD